MVLLRHGSGLGQSLAGVMEWLQCLFEYFYPFLCQYSI